MNSPQPHHPGSDRARGRPRGRPLRTAANPQLSGHASANVTQDMVLSIASDQTMPPARLARLADQLGPTDWAVVHALAALRLATGDQLRRLLFHTPPAHTQRVRAWRALQRLTTLGLVARLVRHVGGRQAGSTSWTWHLSDQAQRLVRIRPSPPQSLVGAREHTLAVAELAIALHEAQRAGVLELVRFEAEPMAWRTYSADGRRHYIRPDAFTIVAAGEWERLWFVELDRGTQSPAVVRRKANAYHAYAATGIEQDKWGVYPRVAYLTTDGDQRCRALARALADTPDAQLLATVAPLADATHTLTHPTTDTEQPT